MGFKAFDPDVIKFSSYNKQKKHIYAPNLAVETKIYSFKNQE